MAVQKGSDPGAHFVLFVTLHNGTQIVISRSKAMDRYITIQSRLEVSQEHQVILDTFSKDQAIQVTNELSLEMARFKIGWLISPVGAPLKSILIVKTVPNTNIFTEDFFVERLDELDSAVILARAAIILALDRHRQSR
jgi:hypothetical protein